MGRARIHDEVTGIDADKRRLRLARHGELACDRIVLSPGVDFMWDQVPALNNADACDEDSARLGKPARRRWR